MKILSKIARTFYAALAFMVCNLPNANATQKQFDINLKELRQSPYDIDLKELRHTPGRRVKPKQKNRSLKPSGSATSPTTVTAGESSNYTVRHGDNISLILTGYYGLSQTEAERLIPRVIRMNNLRSPRQLTIGQSLLIPLAAPGPAQSERTINTEASPSPTASQPTPPATPDKTTPAREIQVHDVSPCLLAKEIAEKLKFRTTPPATFLGTGNVAIAHGERKLVVVCSATPAEAYTTERLLARHNTRLLLFNGNEQPRQVMETILDKLGMQFTLLNGGDGKDQLPATYVFPDINNSGRDLRVTILPTPATPENQTPSPEEKPVSVPQEKPTSDRP